MAILSENSDLDLHTSKLLKFLDYYRGEVCFHFSYHRRMLDWEDLCECDVVRSNVFQGILPFFICAFFVCYLVRLVAPSRAMAPIAP